MHFEPYHTEKLFEVSGNDSSFVLEILTLFAQTLKTEEIEIKAALSDKNWPTVQFIAHRLRSSAGAVGAKNIYVSCKKLEEYIRSGESNFQEIILLSENLFASCIFDLSEIKKELTKLEQNSFD